MDESYGSISKPKRNPNKARKGDGASQKKRIIIADDDTTGQTLHLKLALVMLGFEVELARSFDEFQSYLDRVQRSDPDFKSIVLAVVDGEMEEDDGERCAELCESCGIGIFRWTGDRETRRRLEAADWAVFDKSDLDVMIEEIKYVASRK